MSKDNKDDEFKFQIEMNEYQLRVMMQALSLYYKIGTAQMEELDAFLRSKFWEYYKEATRRDEDEVTALIHDLKWAIFRQHPHNNWDIKSEEVPKDCKEAHDISTVMKRGLAAARLDFFKKKNDSESAKYIEMTTDSTSPLVNSTPPIVFKKIN